YNTISNYFSFDARFFKSFIPLMFRPGYVARQFVLGKRLQFLHPAQYYLFASVVFFFLFSIEARKHTLAVDQALEKGFKGDAVMTFDTLPKPDIDSLAKAKIAEQLEKNKELLDLSEKDSKALDSILSSDIDNNNTNLTFDYDKDKVDSLIVAGAPESEQLKAMGMKDDAGFLTRRFYTQMLKFQKNKGGGILQAFYDSIPIALFFLLPIFALLLKIFYWRRGRFAHHLVFSLYFYSFLFVVMSLVIAANFFWDIPIWIDTLVVISTFLYFLLALRHFYQQGFFLSLIKSGVMTFLYMIFVIPVAVIVMIMASFLFY
ncbi:MAG: DUF3667 domain-containing protein, partial [Bacteroidia bacterium]|nr:DUF3667 domain-containing protein [Bacteroidia bacterium]